MSKLVKVKEDAFNYFAKGKWDKALQAYLTLTKLDPKEPKHYQKVAELRTKLGQKKEAVEAYKQACEVYMSRGFLLQAIAMCKMVVQLDPSEKEMEQRLATLYSQKGIGAPPKAPPVSTPPAPKPPPSPPKVEAKPEPPKPKPTAPIAPQPPPKPQPVEIEPEKAPDEEKKVPVWDLSADTEEESAPEITDLQELEAPATAKSPSKKGLPDTIEPDEVETELPPLDVPLEPSNQTLPSDLPPLMDDELPTEETPSPLEELEAISGLEQKEERAGDEESFDIDVMGDEGEVEEELPEIKEEVSEEKAPPPSKPPLEPKVYDLSEEMEKSPADIKELLEEEWEEGAEEISAQPPDGEKVLEEADIEELDFFPEIPLFKDLGKDEFESVVKRLKALSFKKGDVIVREGEEGDSILIIVSGSVSVYKEVDKGKRIQLGTLTEGDFFGEFGYFAGSVRQASVEALDDVELLEMTRENMDAVVAEFPQVEDVLEKFYKERVMQNILATSTLFRELSLEERRKIASYFKLTEAREGEDIVVEGDEGDSMYFIRSGEVLVHTVNPMGEKIHLAELKAGDFFGEVSLIQGKPRTATVTAVSPVVELMQLNKKDLDTILETHPEILDKLNEVIEKRVSDTVNKVSILDLEDDDLELGSLL